jgi:parallel beta-helix repeat protein
LSTAVLCQSTYFVDVSNGSDSNSGSSESNPWRSIDRVNKQSFRPGDRVSLRRGQAWREMLVVSSSGAAGSPITFGAYGGGRNPLLNASVIPSQWISKGGKIWAARAGWTATQQTFFDGARGMRVMTKDAVDSNLKWTWLSDSVFVYSEIDPARAYTKPGLEISAYPYGINCNGKAHIVIEGIDVTKANSTGIILSDFGREGATDVVVSNLECSYNFALGAGIHIPNATLDHVRSHHNGFSDQHHGFYISNDSAKASNFLVTNCIADSNSGSGFHLYMGSGGTIRSSIAHHNGSLGPSTYAFGFVAAIIEPGETVNFLYNVSYDNNDCGIAVYSLGQNCIANIINNVSFGNQGSSRGYGLYLQYNDNASKVRVVNNILSQNGGSDLFQRGANKPYEVDYNDIYRTSGMMIQWDSYNFAASQHVSYQTLLGLNVHGISRDPLFTDPAMADFTLSSASPCVDVGMNMGLTSDLSGLAVPQGTNPDMGSFERPILLTPRIITPAGGDVIRSMPSTFSWLPSIGADSYRLQISSDSTFDVLLIDSLVSTTSAGIGALKSGGPYFFRVQARKSNGTSAFSQPAYFTVDMGKTDVKDGLQVPMAFELNQNYPNPFNPTTTIEFALPLDSYVTLRIYNTLGVEIVTLLSGFLQAGRYKSTWNGVRYPSGAYFVRFEAGGFTATRRLLLVK